MEYVRKYSNFFVWWWTFACIYGVLHWCANPLFIEFLASDQTNSINHTFKRRNLPFVGWYPLNTDDIYKYFCLYLMQIIGGISSALGIVCYDAFYVTMLIVLCAQFQYINTVLIKINFAKYDLRYVDYFKNSLIMEIKYLGELQRARGHAHSRPQIKELRGLPYRDFKVIFSPDVTKL